MNTKFAELIKYIVETGRCLTSETMTEVCDTLDRLPKEASKHDFLGLIQSIKNPTTRNAFQKLIHSWCELLPDKSPHNLVWALRGTCAMDEYKRHQQYLELVWTGPTTDRVILRRTDQVLLDLIQEAKLSLIIVTFAAHKIPVIAQALRSAVERNVKIDIILESPETDAGKIAHSAFKTLDSYAAEMLKIYVWPVAKREKDEAGRHGSLHVKCAVADDNIALISSANLTGYAFNLNMELGVLIHGGDIPHTIAEHLRQLISNKILILI